MNENIDLTKILKDCPIGWMFYSSVYGYVTFQGIENGSDCPIKFFYIDKDKLDRCDSVTEQGICEPYCFGECTFFPSKDQRDWSKFTAPWYKKDKFNPKTLKPFDKVIARDSNDKWICNIFSYIEQEEEEIYHYTCYPYVCINAGYKYCVPYNDDTKHLIGTREEAPEYYRYWED